MFFGEHVSKAITKVESRRMYAFAPLFVRFPDTQSGCRRYRNDLKVKSLKEGFHGTTNATASRNDKRFGHRARRNQHFGIALKGLDAGVRLRFSQNNGQERRRIYDDHFGRPYSS